MFFTTRIGTLRQQLRASVVKNEISEINELVSEILKLRKQMSHSRPAVAP
jgi:hypothetical protein